MLFRNVVINLAAFVTTWLLVRRLLGETTFHLSDAVAMVVAGISTCLVTVWAMRRKDRKLSKPGI